MTYDEIVEFLGYASGHDLSVRLTLQDGTEVLGVPTSLDTHVTANEVYLRIAGPDDPEVALSLAHVDRVDLG